MAWPQDRMKKLLFHFQQFVMSHHASTMPIGTDAVLLGAWAPATTDTQSVLDIGCGCGVVGMMVAQRAENAKVTFVEMDKDSIQEAETNGENSPWNARFNFYNNTIQEYAKLENRGFDLIVSNPPYFENSLKCPDATRTQSRHTDSLSFEELLDAVATLLSKDGKFAVVLPYISAEKFECLANDRNLWVNEQIQISPKPEKEPNRVLLLIEKKKRRASIQNLVLRNANNEYSQDYKALTQAYHKGL